VDDREILETYSNSPSKNTSDTDIFHHGTKSLLTGVISVLLKPVPFEERIVLCWSVLTSLSSVAYKNLWFIQSASFNHQKL